MIDNQEREPGHIIAVEQPAQLIQPIEYAVFEAVMRKTRTAMVLCDPGQPDCPIVYSNPAFSEMTGYSASCVLGRNCRFMQGPLTDPAAVQRIHEAVSACRPIEQELYNYRKDGSGFWNALHITPIYRDDGSLQYFFANQFDVSARKEAIRRQMQRVESIDALASGVAHEFNNLMTVVLGSVERAARAVVDKNQKQHLERADWAGQRAGQLAGELLALARRKTHQDHSVDLNQFVLSVQDTLRELTPPDITLRFEAATVPLPVRLDPDRLEGVLLNLVRNAVEAMPGGGVIRIALRPLSAPEAESVLHGRQAIELLVEDTGHGMPANILERATELFFTTKSTETGTGLGLFLTLDFVDKSGGRMMLESVADVGTKDLGTKDLGTKDLGAKDLSAKVAGTRVRLIFPRVS